MAFTATYLLAFALFSPNVPFTAIAQNPVAQEWTAMGDSYGSGVGAGTCIDPFYSLCYRFDQAYAPDLQNDLRPKPSKFNFVACAGQLFPDIQKDQLGTSWGNQPSFVTISMGGNDIKFKELVTRCIYGIWMFAGYFSTCDSVIQQSQAILARNDITNGAVATLNAILNKARQQGLTASFKIYVLGYARFFNEVTTQCNSVKGFPSPTYLAKHEPEYLTVELRKRLNKLADDLNAQLIRATQLYTGAPGQVIFVPIDSLFETHRFCDRTEPNEKDPNTWFFTFDSPDVNQEKEREAFFRGIPQFRDMLDGKSTQAMTEAEFIKLVQDASKGDPVKQQENGIGNVKVFHPKSIGHRTIEGVLKTKLQRPADYETARRVRKL